MPPSTVLQVLEKPDAAWAHSIATGRAALWIGSGILRASNVADQATSLSSLLRSLLHHPWAAVLLDVGGTVVDDLAEESLEVSGRPIRFYRTVPAAEPPLNRIPVYLLPQPPEGDTRIGQEIGASQLLQRLQMVQRIPENAQLFVIGLRAPSDTVAISQAADLSPAARQLVVLGPLLGADSHIPGVDEIAHWSASLQDVSEYLGITDSIATQDAALLLRVRSGETFATVDLSSCLDHSSPITEEFETVPLSALLTEPHPELDDLKGFLHDPTSSWRPYALSVPYPRHSSYLSTVFKELRKFEREGAGATSTIWLPAEDGSGATTTLRQLSFDLAAAGYPLLVARPTIERFDFHRLAQFLTRTGERFASLELAVSELPWIIAFDSQHSEIQWDFLTGVAAGLKRLQRPALVLAVRSTSERSEHPRKGALGNSTSLGPPLRNSIALDDAVGLGAHLDKLIPEQLHRSRAEWQQLISDTLRIGPEGNRSLFWVALRFWLFRIPGTEMSFGAWLKKHLSATVSEHSQLYASLLEIAALSKHRLQMPRQLLLPDALSMLRMIVEDPAHLLGLVAIRQRHATSFAFAQTLIADELLRLASKDEAALSAIDMPTCRNAFDLELYLLERLLTRESIGDASGIRIVEELVTSALRVDPREAPRNFQERDRIVAMLEAVPDVVWDDSQILNHHAAKARRHLALDPPDSSWTQDAVREQLELAEYHLLDAIDNVRPSEPDRQESALNLEVSLALTHDARARFEHRCGDEIAAAKYRTTADATYRAAQRLDADNPYVLENFARFKLHQQAPRTDGEERIALVVDAIGLLEWEMDQDAASRRAEPILLELANAYEALEEGNGRQMLEELARLGSEAAMVALAKLATRIDTASDAVAQEALIEAERILKSIPGQNVSSRSLQALYSVVSRLSPLDFVQRLDILKSLDREDEFPMPLQLLLEFGVLLMQAGSQADRKEGEGIFREVRDQLGERSGGLNVPSELRFLTDPASGFRQRLRTAIVVRNLADGGRNYFGIPVGWGTVAIPMRVIDFGPNLRPGSERDCYVRFTNFGPQAAPPTLE